MPAPLLCTAPLSFLKRQHQNQAADGLLVQNPECLLCLS